jgi:hypothetical protein
MQENEEYKVSFNGGHDGVYVELDVLLNSKGVGWYEVCEYDSADDLVYHAEGSLYVDTRTNELIDCDGCFELHEKVVEYLESWGIRAE